MQGQRLVIGAALLAMAVVLASGLLAKPRRPAPVGRAEPAAPPVRHASPATLARVLAAARGGETIELAGGDYGVFHGALKKRPVVLRAAPRASVRMAVEFNPAANITLDGIRISALLIADKRSHDLTVRNSRFDRSQAIIRTGDLSRAHIVLDHNVHAGFVKCAGCYEGRVQLAGRTQKPSGVTIRDSLFTGGNSDGIQNGGNRVRIIGNTFSGIHQVDGTDGVHADAIQLYGSKGTVIQGNRMKQVATGIMAPDGADHEIIEGNVIATDGYPFAITLGGDRGSVLKHNRIPGGACHYGLRCGTVRIGVGNDGTPSRGTVVQDNVLGSVAVDASSRPARSGPNLLAP